jgi:hypothetical protein
MLAPRHAMVIHGLFTSGTLEECHEEGMRGEAEGHSSNTTFQIMGWR